MRPLTVGELYDRAVRHGGDRPALTQDGRSITYADLGRDALRLAAALQALGVARHDRIAFLMANCIEYVACEYATARIGATRVPLATLLGGDDHVYMMNFARCRVLVYHREVRRAGRADAAAARVRRALHLRGQRRGRPGHGSPAPRRADRRPVAGPGRGRGRPGGHRRHLLHGWHDRAPERRDALASRLVPHLLRRAARFRPRLARGLRHRDADDPRGGLPAAAGAAAARPLRAARALRSRAAARDHGGRARHGDAARADHDLPVARPSGPRSSRPRQPAQRAVRRRRDCARAARAGARRVRAGVHAVLRPDRGADGAHRAAARGARRTGPGPPPRSCWPRPDAQPTRRRCGWWTTRATTCRPAAKAN